MIKNIFSVYKDIFKEGGNKIKAFAVKKDRIIKELNETIELLGNEVLPPLEDICLLIEEKKITDKELSTSQAITFIAKNYKQYKNSPANVLKNLRTVLSGIINSQNDIVKCYEKSFKSAVTTDRTITASEICCIDMLKAINLVTTFTSDLLVCVAFDIRGGSSLNKRFLAKVNAGIVAYMTCVENLQPNELKTRLDKIPGLPKDNLGEAMNTIMSDGIDVETIDSSDSVSVGMLKSLLNRASSFAGSIFTGAAGRAGFVYSPIYHLRMAWADFQVSRYESLKNNKQATEAIILDLRLKKEGSNDPTIDKQIKYYEDKLVAIQYRIEEYEKDLRD